MDANSFLAHGTNWFVTKQKIKMGQEKRQMQCLGLTSWPGPLAVLFLEWVYKTEIL